MALTYSRPGDLGSTAPSFSLKGVSPQGVSQFQLSDFDHTKVLVVVFMCNHCPYVIAVQDRISRLAREYASKGVQLIGISSNDASRYLDDSFEEMQKRSAEMKFAFPYLYDESQEVAKAYGAVCTPEFYAYQNAGNGQFLLEYKGRLDDSWKDEKAVTRRELAEALDQILAGVKLNPDQKPAMGCSIKWK